MKEYNKTKILATLGPQTATTEKIKQLVNTGINAVRLNMSHGDHNFYSSIFENIHTARTDLNVPLAVLADLQGPKIRIGELKNSELEIESGNTIEITIEDILGDEKIVSTSYKNLSKEAEVGELILINDGLIRLRITEKKKDSVICEIENGGTISPRKGAIILILIRFLSANVLYLPPSASCNQAKRPAKTANKDP